MSFVSRAVRGALAVAVLTTVAVPFVAAPAQAVAPSGTTTLLSPTEGDTVGGEPTLSWSAVPGAAKYRVQVSRSELFDTTVFAVDTVNVHATPPNALPTGVLYWRVAPTDGGSGVGQYTTGSFQRQWASAPEPVIPADNATLTYPDDPLLFTWQPLAGAQRYNIQIDDDVNFVNPLTSTSTPNTSYTLLDPQTNDQQFFWRVQGVSGSVNSEWSAARSYQVVWPATPVLTSPSVGQSVADVVLQWSPVSGAASYQVQISPNPDFTNNITVDAIVKGTRYSPQQTLQNGSYFWRVRARDGKTVANLGGWSSLIDAGNGALPAQFTRSWNDRPVLLSPANEDYNVVVPTLKWTPVPHASHYEIWLGTDMNFTPTSYWVCYTNQTSFTPYGIQVGSTVGPVPNKCDISAGRIPVGQLLYWKVRGVDAPEGVLGVFSEPSSFVFKHDHMVEVNGPADGAVVTTPELTWQPVLGVSRYKVSITQNGGHITGSPFTTYGTSYTPDNLVAGKSYAWWVQTYDDQDRSGLAPFSARGFTYQPAEAVNNALALVTPSNGTSTMVWPAMRWEPVVGASKYEIFAGPVATGVVSKIGDTNATSFTSTAIPPAGGQYQWLVRAYNLSGNTLATSGASTFTMGAFSLTTGLLPAKCVDTTCPAAPETPMLTWDRQPYASGYLVYLANDAEFTNIVRVYKTQHPALTPRESLLDSVAGQAYYWFVRPCRWADGSEGCGRYDTEAFPTAGAFRKRSLPVAPLSPADGATVPAEGSSTHQNITFTWSEYAATNAAAAPPSTQGAKQYRIQVSTVADFATLVDDQLVDQTTYTPHSKTYPEGPLYWRVGAVDGSGNQLTYSPARQVIKATPKIAPLYPAPGQAVGTTPYFQWAAQPHAKSYELEVYKNGDDLFSSVNKVSIGTNMTLTTRLTAYTPTTSLPAGAYAWRVRRIDIDNKPGPWSSGGVFTLSAGTPTLISPATDTVFSAMDMVFDWTAVSGAAKYRFEASTGAGFATLTESATTVMTSWAPVVKYPDGRVYWRVKVLDGDNNVVAISETRSVVRDGTAPTVTTKTPTSGAPVKSAAFTVTFSEKVTGVSTSTFTMKQLSTGNPVPGTVTPSAATETTTATFKPSVVLTPGETYTLGLTAGVADLNGNGLVPFSWNVRTELVVDALSPAVQQYWDRDTSTSASGGGYLASRTSGAKVSYSFTGTSASILGRKAADGGYAAVYLDGVKQATVSFYSSTTRFKQVVWSKSGLANSAHTVELRVLGTKPSGATSTWVYPDAFRYGTTTLEETSASVVQAHRNVSLSGAVGKSYVLAAHTASGDNGTQPYVVMKFKGTGVSWRGIRGTSGGIAKVYVDNVLRATVDTYGTASTSGQTLWSASGLSSSTHTLKIVLTGTKRSSSSGYNVTFDSFGVS